MSTSTGLPTVPTTTLGRTGLTTSRLALGAYGWGGAGPERTRLEGDAAIVEALRAAFDAGIRCVHTAEAYDNEALLGRLLPEAGAPADLLVFTKFGHGKGFTADQFRASAERTLKDLRIEKIPLMFVHDPRDDDDLALVMGKGGALEALHKLQSEGLLGYIGMATGTLRPLQVAVESGEFDAIQFPRLQTLLNQTATTSGLLAAAKAKNIATVAAAPFVANILATGAIDGAVYNYFPPLPEVIESVKRMEQRSTELGADIRDAALAYLYTDPLIDQVVPGMVSPQEIRQNVRAFGSSLTRAQVKSIAEAGAIDPVLIGGPEFRTAWPADRRPSR
jgi:D-threo-aldose 1-dehydrogenase